MKLKSLLCLFLAYGISISGAFATKLPDNVFDYIKKEEPKAGVRFDGLITLPDGTIYLPVLPSQPNKEGIGAVAQTYPANKKFSQKPDMLLFDTNYGLLKVLKTKQGKPTFTDSNNIPLVIKTGLLPQDLLVPPGLIVQDDLKILLGDLKIPTMGSYVNNFFSPEQRTVPVKAEAKIVPAAALKNKTLLMTSLESTLVNVVPSDSSTPKFTLKLENLPRFVEPVDNDKYLLVATSGKTYIDVADMNLEVLAKKIDLSYQPSEIVLNNNLAYVSVSDSESLFVIDLKTMALIEKIKIKGYPKNLAIDETGTYLGYVDKSTGDIYTLDISNKGYENKLIVNCSNVSKVLLKDNIIYVLSRTKNSLQVIDRNLSSVIYEHEVGAKPIDMIAYKNNLYVLSATNVVSVFNLIDYKMEKIEKLSTNGFSKQIVKIPNSELAIITNAVDKKYFVFDLNKNTVIQTVPTVSPVNNLKLINKPLK